MLLIFSLLFTVVLLILIGSVASLSRQGRFVSQSYANDVAAVYAAEAGVADAMEHLNEDNTWAPTTPYRVELPNGQGSYSIQFTSSPTAGQPFSVNNLYNRRAAAGPNGGNSVPATSVYLVVNGSSGGATAQVHSILQATPFRSMRGPFVTTGKITLKGNVQIKGVRSFEDFTRVEAGIHSNLSGTEPETVTWSGQIGEQAFIDGQVTASSVAPDAINMTMGPSTNYQATSGESNGEGAKKFPRIDVERLVDRAADQAVPTVSPPTVGGFTISGGDQRITRDTVINGDLVINDCNLFIDGSLTVNGSITGNGSIFVNGETTFSGATQVSVGSTQHIALYSKSHVKLEGFDGSKFLDAVAAADPPTFQQPLQATRNALEMLQEGLDNSYNINPNTPYGGEGSDVDLSRSILGQYVTQNFINNHSYLADEGFVAADSRSVMQLKNGLRPMLGNDPSEDPTIQFLLAKLDRIERMTGPRRYWDGDGWVNNCTNADVQRYIQDGTVTTGLLDFINDGRNNGNTDIARTLVATELQSLDFDFIGTSYFKGLIFSGGAIHSSNDVEVFGGFYAQRNANSPTEPLRVDDVDYNAGDVFLDRGCRITYVEKLLEDAASFSSRNLVVPIHWALPGR